MTFPTTSVLDNFNRSNVGPPLDGNWTTIGAYSGFKIVSNQMIPGDTTAVVAAQRYTGGPYSDPEAYITVVNVADSYDSIGFGFLFSDSADSNDGYEVDFYFREGNANVHRVEIYRIDNGTPTQLGSSITGLTFVDSDVLGASVISGAVKVYQNGSELGSRSDSTYTGTKNLNMFWWYSDPSTSIFDDFGGGAASGVTTPAPSVSDGVTLGESQTVRVSDPQVSVSDSLTIGESHDVDVVSDEPGGTLSVSVTPDNPAYQVRGVRVYP